MSAAGAPGVCAICGGPVAPRPGNRDWPFCSARCRLIDLGNWLGEAYRIPGARAGDGAVGAEAGEGKEGRPSGDEGEGGG
jgi:endogenous inhibitor of DNA gyrase (YacG/DUF329 family)